MERRKLEPSLSFVYTPHSLIRVHEKISRYLAQFYKDLRIQTVQFGEALEKKAEQVQARAIGRLTPRLEAAKP